MIQLFGRAGTFTVTCNCPPYLIAQKPRTVRFDFEVRLQYPVASATIRPLKSNESVEVVAEPIVADSAAISNHNIRNKSHNDTDLWTRLSSEDLASQLASHNELTLTESSDTTFIAHSSDFSGVGFTLLDYLENEGQVGDAASKIEFSMGARKPFPRAFLYACCSGFALIPLYLLIGKFRRQRENRMRSSAPSEVDREVFISYKTEDRQIAERLLAALESRGLSCWIAPRDIPPGQVWAAAIEEGLQRSKTFVLLLSSHSIADKQISREAELADQQNIPMITVRLEDVRPPRGLEYFLGNLQWLDAFGGQFDSAVNRLAAMIPSSAIRPAAGK